MLAMITGPGWFTVTRTLHTNTTVGTVGAAQFSITIWATISMVTLDNTFGFI
jgi:hypothetical protein